MPMTAVRGEGGTWPALQELSGACVQGVWAERDRDIHERPSGSILGTQLLEVLPLAIVMPLHIWAGRSPLVLCCTTPSPSPASCSRGAAGKQPQHFSQLPSPHQGHQPWKPLPRHLTLSLSWAQLLSAGHCFPTAGAWVWGAAIGEQGCFAHTGLWWRDAAQPGGSPWLCASLATG